MTTKLSIPGGSCQPKTENEGTYLWEWAYSTSMGQYLDDIEAKFITKSVAALKERPVLALDAGAGSGRLTKLLAARFDRVVATEAEPALVRGLRRAGSNVTPVLVPSDAERLPLRDDSADCILCIQAADLTHAGWFHRESARVLKPGGVLVMTLQNRRSWKGLLAGRRQDRYRAEFGTTYYTHSLDDIRTDLEEAGLEVERTLGYNWLPFTRVSDSRLIKPLAKLERWLLLPRLAAASPWVLLCARKPSSPESGSGRVAPAARSRSPETPIR